MEIVDHCANFINPSYSKSQVRKRTWPGCILATDGGQRVLFFKYLYEVFNGVREWLVRGEMSRPKDLFCKFVFGYWIDLYVPQIRAAE